MTEPFRSYELIVYKGQNAQIIAVENGWVVLIKGGNWEFCLDTKDFEKLKR